MPKSCSICEHFNQIRSACQRCEKAVKVARPILGPASTVNNLNQKE